MAVIITIPLFLLSFCFCVAGNASDKGVGALLALGGGLVIAWALGGSSFGDHALADTKSDAPKPAEQTPDDSPKG
jgi:hypothetical protein